MKLRLVAFTLALFLSCALGFAKTTLKQGFAKPPASARPWVYWFWLNGNINSNGITADLEAMQRAGIGGVLIMEVDQGTPAGPAAFAGSAWRELFKHVVAEARRLGLEVNMNNDAGWCGSGGPWITPELSMQKVVWAETNISGPVEFKPALPQPQIVSKFYRDIAVFAFPTPPSNDRLADYEAKSALTPTFIAPRSSFPPFPAEQVLSPNKLLLLTDKLDKNGQLTWNVPEGEWTIVRIGHTSTGKDNHPAPEPGRGLECDKLSRPAVKAMFDGLMGKLIADSKYAAGKTLVATHIDSWEVGSQNWTPEFVREFRARRGYDLQPWLPAMSGRVIGSVEQTERFLWDLRQTISDLLLQNYASYFRELAHEHGMRLSIEAYSTCPVDELAYAGRADEPMGEFWSWGKYGMAFSCTEMTSAAHVYGRKIIGAEAFTAGDQEKWLGHPGNIKDLGDWAFCEGINRFVFHRYAFQPWDNARPGMSMGPWGLHYERTQTWWEQSRPWHEYLARCQYLLQQGLFVADICLLSPEGSPQTIDRQNAFLLKAPGTAGAPLERPGHNFDVCPPEALMARMSVSNGLLTLPDGMTYRMLALPQVETMTPGLLRKIRELVRAGAVVAGPRPLKSPSLTGYPACDTELNQIADELWGTKQLTEEIAERQVGKGSVICGAYFERARALNGYVPPRLREAQWIWHNEGNPAAAAPPEERYFRKIFSVERNSVKSARLMLTADNRFECWLNGQTLGSGSDFSRLYTFDLAPSLRDGTNVLAILAANLSEHPNPAGVIGGIFLEMQDSNSTKLLTDDTWESSKTVEGEWRASVQDKRSWSLSKALGKMGMAPWNNIELNFASTEIYPDIEFLGKLLRDRGIPPDFGHQTVTASQVLRFIHKRIDTTEVYFVANKSVKPEQVLCSFRTRGRRPELWRPETGETERVAMYNETNGITSLPLSFGPFESVFVIFRKDSKPEPDRIVSLTRHGQTLVSCSEPPAELGRHVQIHRDARGHLSVVTAEPGNYVAVGADGSIWSCLIRGGDSLVPVIGRSIRRGDGLVPESSYDIPGPWRVEFEKNLGAPQAITLEKLTPLNQHPEPGVKFFSGQALYSCTFAIRSELLQKGQRLFLDLGRVAVAADVELNGRRIGTVWNEPYRLEITGHAKKGENRLRIKVANLWINRQIGDEQLPEDSDRNANGTLKSWPQWLQEGKSSPTGRYTFTSWRLWKKNSPLHESGLIGPVRIVPAREVQLTQH